VVGLEGWFNFHQVRLPLCRRHKGALGYFDIKPGDLVPPHIPSQAPGVSAAVLRGAAGEG